MKSEQKSKNRSFPKSESMLFFQGPPTKRELSDIGFQGNRKPSAICSEEVERKTRTNFPELFRLRDQGMQYPFDIPYQLQHVILATAQNILEECCYDFARRWFPLELENAKLDCAEALELTKWTRLISKQSERLPSDAFATKRTISQDMLISVHLLRHTAVHRLRTTARGVSKLIQYAIVLTEALKDSIRTLQLEDLYRQVKAKIKDKEDEEYALDSGITAILQNQLDGIVPQGDKCSIEEEITALFEMLPPRPELQTERHGSDYRV